MEPSRQRLRILVTGRDGQVGWELARSLAALGEVTATGRAELDLCSDNSIREVVRAVQPNLIVNAAAYTAVDRAESETELARRINAGAVAVLAAEAKRANAAVIHYSTEYVFDGSKLEPYMETDAPNPLSVYGETKLAGERTLAESGVPSMVLRTSWVYGTRGKNFLRTILKLAAEKPELRIVDDQIGAPTWSRDIAQATSAIVKQWMAADPRERAEIYHLTASGATTWYGFAAELLRLCESLPNVNAKRTHLVPISTAEYPTPATRPKNSRLDCGKLAREFHCRLPDWRDSAAAVMAEIAAGEMRADETMKVQAVR